MSREIKFRAWHPNTKEMMPVETIDWDETGYLTEVSAGYTWGEKFDPMKFKQLVLMQFTGLKDNSERSAEIYEGDIINEAGQVVGNKYESPQILEKRTNQLIEGMGTNAWRDTESIAMGRGCKYA